MKNIDHDDDGIEIPHETMYPGRWCNAICFLSFRFSFHFISLWCVYALADVVLVCMFGRFKVNAIDFQENAYCKMLEISHYNGKCNTVVTLNFR